MQWQTNFRLSLSCAGLRRKRRWHVGAVIDAGFDAVEIPLNSPQWEKSIPPLLRLMAIRR
jgi:2-dehydro-3-deoxyphosphogalactonate aldolase